jgi:hypothetical protein
LTGSRADYEDGGITAVAKAFQKAILDNGL